jgi:hypothetical protein
MKYNPDLSKAKSKDIAKDHIDFDSEDHLDVLYDAVSYTFGWSDSQKVLYFTSYTIDRFGCKARYILQNNKYNEGESSCGCGRVC